MFSGVIEKKAKILSIENGVFHIENVWGKNLKIGESIAHDGACMTVDNFDEKSYSFFVMEESLKKTNFYTKKTGDFFNVEQSLSLGDRLDGHFILGHVDNIGIVQDIIKNNDLSRYVIFEFDEKYNHLLVEKGSISISGISLTVIDIKENTFSVSLIPLTQERTNLGDLKKGDKINLEFDILGKYAEKLYNKNNICRHTK